MYQACSTRENISSRFSKKSWRNVFSLLLVASCGSLTKYCTASITIITPPKGLTLLVKHSYFNIYHAGNTIYCLIENSMQRFVYDPHTTISNVETFLQDFFVNSEAFASELTKKSWRPVFYVLQPHSRTLPVTRIFPLGKNMRGRGVDEGDYTVNYHIPMVSS